MKKSVVPTIATILVGVFPVLFLFLRNSGEVYLIELITPLAVYGASGLGIFVFLSLILNSQTTGALCAFPAILLFQNYATIEKLITKIFPALKWWHILPLLIYILFYIVKLIKRYVKDEFAGDCVVILGVVFAGLIVVNMISAAPTLVKRITAQSNADVTVQENNDYIAKKTSGPNVYWLLFDEYSNFDVIEKYYGYDNSSFAADLEEKGFAVSYNSVNDSQQTTTILANYVAMEYLANDSMTTSERVQIRRDNNRIFSLMRQNGYQLRGIGGTVDEFPMDGNHTVNASSTIEGDTFSLLLLKKTVIKCFLPEVQSEQAIALKRNTALFEDLDFYQEQGCFTMWYECFPHQPFIFKRDGTESDLSKRNDWVDPEAYLGSYIYATEVLKKCVNNILANDPNCIIVLQSDHSARSLQDVDGNYLIDKYDRRHCLNAVYYMGEDISEIQGQSGVNTWRLIMNRLFGTNYSILEVPVSEYEF